MKYILFILLLPFLATAQNQLSHTHTAVFFEEGITKNIQLQELLKLGIDAQNITQFGSRNVAFIAHTPEIENALLNHHGVAYMAPVFTNAKNEFVTYTPRFFVKLKNESDLHLLHREADKIGVQIIGANQFNADIIEIQTNKFGIDAQAAVQLLKATKLFEIVSPNLMHSVSDCSVDDPRYNKQWSLKNEGTPIQGNGTVGADMNVEAAWAITTGSPNIKIAIMDSGVDTLHPELVGKLRPGFDAFGAGTNGYPIPTYDSDGHGTACAGIAAAHTNNAEGIAGVCQDCEVIPIRIFEYQDILGTVQPWSETQVFIDGLSWMWQEADADVSSNSWGIPDALLAIFPGADTLVNAIIDDALDQGRGGLGTPMLFSSGNDGLTDTIPIWPARYERTIAVGASSMCDEHKSGFSCDGEAWWAGNWGEGLDVSAPGVRVATIDMMGANGFHNTQYYDNFGGTSAACPNAAGVVALMLSHTPTLPQWLVRKVLSSTSDKVGGYDYSTWKWAGAWSKELGYGRVNAYEAVAYGASSVAELSAEKNVLVQTHTNYHVIKPAHASKVEWVLFDINGRAVRTGTAVETITISHAGLSTGIYALQLRGTSMQETVKLLVP